MVYKYRIIREAKQDIEDIVNHISTVLCNPEAAVDFLNEFDRKLEIVCETPKIGTVITNELFIRDNIRRIILKNYYVYYFIDGQNKIINVMRVVYNRRDQFIILSSIMSDDLNH